eukprot:gene8118-7480_t
MLLALRVPGARTPSPRPPPPGNECANGRLTGTAPDQICNKVPGNGDTCGITCNDPNDAVTQFDTFIQGDTTTHFQCLGGIDCDSAHVACATPRIQAFLMYTQDNDN